MAPADSICKLELVTQAIEFYSHAQSRECISGPVLDYLSPLPLVQFAYHEFCLCEQVHENFASDSEQIMTLAAMLVASICTQGTLLGDVPQAEHVPLKLLTTWSSLSPAHSILHYLVLCKRHIIQEAQTDASYPCCQTCLRFKDALQPIQSCCHADICLLTRALILLLHFHVQRQPIVYYLATMGVKSYIHLSVRS